MSETSATAPIWHRLRSGISHVLLILVAILFLGPLVYAVSTSLKPADEVFTPTPELFGSEIRWQNYADAFTFAPFGRYFLNSLFVAVAGTLVVVVASSMSAYAFARLKFRGREQLFVLFLGTLMVPQEVLIVPMYWLMQSLGWVDSYWALILPWAFTAFGTFLLRQFFLSIPKDLEEAALIDGANHFDIYWRIMLPLAKPALATLAIFTFMGSWNDFLHPLIFLNSTRNFTLTVGLAFFQGSAGTDYTRLMAGVVVSVLPILIVYSFAQKYFTQGVILSGVKG